MGGVVRRLWRIVGQAARAGLGAALAALLCLGGGAASAQAQGPVEPGMRWESEPGIVVLRVTPDGPAAEAGVERGDILLAVDGETLATQADLLALLQEREPGDEVTLTVQHGDDVRELETTLGVGDDGRPVLGLLFCAGAPRWAGPKPGPGWGWQEPRPGARIVAVADDSPASVAGLEAGDVIVAVDGEPLGPGRDLAALLGEWAPGDEVTLGVMDGGELPGSMVQPREVTVTLGEHPDAQGRPYLGVRVTPAMPEMAPGGPAPGALVNLVADGGPADAAGLEQRDVILALDGKEILTPQELVDAIGDRQPGDEVVLTVRRPASRDADGQSQRLEVTVTLGEHPDDGQEGRAYLGVHLAPLMRPEAMPRPGPRSVQGAEEKDAGPADDGGLPLLRRLPWLRRVPGLRRLIPDLRGERGAPEGSTGPGLDRAGLGRSPVWSAP